MDNYHTTSIDEILKKFNTSTSGLSQLQVTKLLTLDGYNVLKAGKKRTLLNKILAQFNDVMIIVLLIASLVSGLLGEVTDAIIILTIV